MLPEMMAKWTDSLPDWVLGGGKQPFALHHPDLSVSNIFVDKVFNISCIIDWAFCSAVPFSMLLTAPSLPQYRHELDASLLPAFEQGFRHAAQKTLGHEGVDIESGDCWLLHRSRPMWLFSRMMSFDSLTDFDLFKDLWASLGDDDQDVEDVFRSKQSSRKYITLYSELKEEDQTPDQVAKHERDYDSGDEMGKTISRKLTLVSQWTSRY